MAYIKRIIALIDTLMCIPLICGSTQFKETEDASRNKSTGMILPSLKRSFSSSFSAKHQDHTEECAAGTKDPYAPRCIILPDPSLLSKRQKSEESAHSPLLLYPSSSSHLSSYAISSPIYQYLPPISTLLSQRENEKLELGKTLNPIYTEEDSNNRESIEGIKSIENSSLLKENAAKKSYLNSFHQRDPNYCHSDNLSTGNHSSYCHSDNLSTSNHSRGALPIPSSSLSCTSTMWTSPSFSSSSSSSSSSTIPGSLSSLPLSSFQTEYELEPNVLVSLTICIDLDNDTITVEKSQDSNFVINQTKYGIDEIRGSYENIFLVFHTLNFSCKMPTKRISYTNILKKIFSSLKYDYLEIKCIPPHSHDFDVNVNENVLQDSDISIAVNEVIKSEKNYIKFVDAAYFVISMCLRSVLVRQSPSIVFVRCLLGKNYITEQVGNTLNHLGFYECKEVALFMDKLATLRIHAKKIHFVERNASPTLNSSFGLIGYLAIFPLDMLFCTHLSFSLLEDAGFLNHSISIKDIFIEEIFTYSKIQLFDKCGKNSLIYSKRRENIRRDSQRKQTALIFQPAFYHCRIENMNIRLYIPEEIDFSLSRYKYLEFMFLWIKDFSHMANSLILYLQISLPNEELIIKCIEESDLCTRVFSHFSSFEIVHKGKTLIATGKAARR